MSAAVRVAALAVILASASPSAAQEAPSAEAAMAAYAELDLERAQTIVDELLASDPSAQTRAQALVVRALIAYQKGRTSSGRDDLAAALALDPRVPLPEMAPPHVREDYTAAQQRVLPPSAAAATAAPPAPPRVVAAPAPERGTPDWWLPALGAGGGVIVTSVFYAWALLTKSAIESSPHARGDLEGLQSRYDIARVGVAAGALVTTGQAAVVVVLLTRSPPGEQPPAPR